MPQNLSIQGHAFLTNAFANDLAGASLASLVLAGSTPSPHPWIAWIWFGVATLLGLGAALSHFSSFIILATTMATTAMLMSFRTLSYPSGE